MQKKKRSNKDKKVFISNDEFYNCTKIFFDEQLLRVIFCSDLICICNVCNALYVVFNYTVSSSGAIGLHLEPKYIEGMIKDNNLFFHLCKALGRNKLSENIFVFDDEMYKYLKNVKIKTDKEGSYVDLEYEKEILSKI